MQIDPLGKAPRSYLQSHQICRHAFSGARNSGYKTDCDLLPDIDGLKDNFDVLKRELKILGVVVDHRLQWRAHVASIISRAKRQMAYLRHLFGSNWGIPLYLARQL